jgi:hypothetical protein
MMGGVALMWLRIAILLVLGLAALAKYLFGGRVPIPARRDQPSRQRQGQLGVVP